MMINRRKFLLGTGLTGLTAYSNNISFGINYNNNPSCNFNDNAVIYLFLHGGPTHIETFNPIPNATSERRSIVGSLNTNVTGMTIGGLWSNLATKGDKYCVVNSFHHRDANHESAQHWMLTGEPTTPNSPPKWPSYGSVICGQYGTNNKVSGLPNYVKLNPTQYDAAAWMGSKFQGYTAAGDGVSDLMLKDENRFRSKLQMLQAIENGARFNIEDKNSKGWVDLRNQATEVLFGKAGEAFILDKDPDFDNFGSGKDQLGKDILTAIRLVEKGVKFVNIIYGAWDMHTGMEAGLKERVPRLDNFVARFFEAAERRQLNHKVLFVMSGDFGRTPKVNKDAGRDHWPGLVPLFLASDSYEMGRVIGSSDSNAEAPNDKPFEPEDLKWTIFNHMGITKEADWYSIENRPMMFTKESAKNILV
jgi:hypothetical protein